MARTKLNSDANFGGGGGEKLMTGVYVRRAIIKAIEDKSNYPGQIEVKTFGSGYQPEICLVISVEENNFEKDLYLFGKFKRDKKSKKIIGWDDWSNAVQRFLYKILPGEAEIEDESKGWMIPEDILKKAIGRELVFISYISTKIYESDQGPKQSYQTWNRVYHPDDDIEEMKDEWLTALQWIKDYDPTVAEKAEKDYKDNGTSFNPDELENNSANRGISDEDII